MAIVAARLDMCSPSRPLIDHSRVDELLEYLEEIRAAILYLNPDANQEKVLDRAYQGVVSAQRGLLELMGYRPIDSINRELLAD